MRFHRVDRVAIQILKNASEVLNKEVKDADMGFVTFSRAEVSGDLKYAKIYFTVLGTEGEKQLSIIALERSRLFIQSRIGKLLGLKYTPQISFHLDKGLDNSFRVKELLKKIHDEIGERNSSSAKNSGS